MALASSVAFSAATLPHGYTPNLRVFACKPPGGSRPQPRRRQPQRRRRLKQEDSVAKVHIRENYWEPFIERHIRRVRDQGIDLNDDVERLKLQRENKFELILELAEEANEFLVNHPEEAIHKKPALKVISDAVNQSGTIQRPDAYSDATFEFLEDLGMF
ncbi:hypothetical protein GOP47_0024632 [Adiantum capillus-veneris]|uniref:Uncharacterized protein n=1 Tax=Adiantum capillus-veneris TaxID=13818 RepID=A0A9D4U2M0_ADICA|nr:hypothetical protein GOP47_0024632 [Adiantum capillus-veneris]